MEPLTFIADAHLGKLARLLRLLGFDTLYSNAFLAAELRHIARAPHCVVLSRNTLFEKDPDVRSCVIKSETPEEQLLQVIMQYNLQNRLRPFTRCLVCNGMLAPIEKDQIVAHLEPKTATYYNAFWQCEACRRIYWKGAHYNRMQALIERIQQQV